jgi:hypothetical protein
MNDQSDQWLFSFGNAVGGREAGEDSLIIRLSRLGWPDDTIAAHLNIRVDSVIESRITFDEEEVKQAYLSGVRIPRLAKRFHIDIQTAWSIVLEDRDDLERVKCILDIEGERLKTDDVWNFGRCFSLTGTNYPGRIPGQIIINLLYYFADAGALVIDPMAGGGTTVDACLLMNRRCYGYDLRAHKSRRDIIAFDITRQSGQLLHKADLVFLDPPYFIKKADEYGLTKRQQTMSGFFDFARNWVDFADLNVKKAGIVALLISDYVDYSDPRKSFFSDDIVELFERRRYVKLYKIHCPLMSSQYKGAQINDARRLKRLLIRGRELYILRKEKGH